MVLCCFAVMPITTYFNRQSGHFDLSRPNIGRSGSVLLSSYRPIYRSLSTSSLPSRTAYSSSSVGSVAADAVRSHLSPATVDLLAANAIGKYTPPLTYRTAHLRTLVTHHEDPDYSVDEANAKRLHGVLQQLRRHGDDVDYEWETPLRGSSGSVRAELDSFASTLGGLQSPSVRGGRGTTTTTAERATVVDGLPFGDRVAMTRGELTRLEDLVNRTFDNNRSRRVVVGVSKPVVTGTQIITDEPNFYLANGPGGDYTQSDTLAALAVRWAEERRRAVEREIGQSRATSVVGSPLDIVTRSQRVQRTEALSPLIATNFPVRDFDGYVVLNSTSVEPSVAMDTKRSASRLSPYEFRAESSTRDQQRYTRSVSATPVGRTPSEYDWATLKRTFAPGESRILQHQQPSKPQISETRRKVRQILCKSRGDPHYFERRTYDDDE